MAEEGWYTDPFRLHEQRWFSDGTPTYLVRDGGKTSKDAPPDGPFVESPVLVEPPPSDGSHRAQCAEDGGVDPVDAAWTYFTRSSSGF